MRLFAKKPVPIKPSGQAVPCDDDLTEVTPIVSIIAADLAVRAGQNLVRRSIEQGLLNGKPAPTGRVIHGQTLKETLIGTMLAGVARRSVPGAILIGGGLLAKALHDRRVARQHCAVIERS